jgi:hypothetical protein
MTQIDIDSILATINQDDLADRAKRLELSDMLRDVGRDDEADLLADRHTCEWVPDPEWMRDESNECVHGVSHGGADCPICDCPGCSGAGWADDVSVRKGEVVRPWTLYMHEECGGDDTVTIYAPTQDAACDVAGDTLQTWVESGDYSDGNLNGCAVSAYWRLYDPRQLDEDGDEVMVADARVTVEIEPDHDELIRRAGGDTDCDHDFISTVEVEGGCDSNPGVWSTGGTSMRFKSHCRHCGLKKTEHHCGSQRNPGEHDTVSYEMPDSWCGECESEECSCEGNK